MRSRRILTPIHVAAAVAAGLAASCGSREKIVSTQCTPGGNSCPAGEACDAVTGFCTPTCIDVCADSALQCDKARSLCVNCLDDAAEPDNAPTAAQALKLVDGRAGAPGRVLCGSDTDWFSVNLEVGDRLTGTLFHSKDQGTMSVDAFGPQPETQVGTSQDTPVGAAVVLTAPSAGVYWLRVTGKPAAKRIDYEMVVQALTGCKPDADEPNNFPLQAKLINPEPRTNLTVCPGDQDFYAVKIDAGQRLTAGTVFSASAGSLRMELIASDLVSVMAEAKDPTDGQLIVQQIGRTGTYYLRIFGADKIVSNRYDLVVELSAGCQADSREPNGSPLSATALTPPVSERLSLCNADEDWFKVDAKAGQILNGQVRFPTAQGDLQLDLYSTDRTTRLATSQGASDSEEIERLITADGSYYLRVYGRTASDQNTYTLDVLVRGTPCIADTSEPNNTPLSATLWATPAPAGLSICNGDRDYFAVDVKAGQVISAVLQFKNGDGDLDLRVRALNGMTVLADSAQRGQDTESVQVPVAAAGKYYIEVYGSDFFQSNTYTLTITVTGSECAADAQEPNNAPANATAVTSGTAYTGSACIGDHDWYAFDVVQGQAIDISAKYVRANGALNFCLVDRDTVTNLTCDWSWSSLSDDVRLRWLLTAAGRYYLHVWSAGNYSNGYITIVTLAPPCANDTDEPNNSAPAATVGKDNGSTINGVVCIGDDDWYAIDVTQGQTMKVAVARQAGSLVTTCLVDRDQVTNLACQWGWDATLNATLQWNLTATGRYYVHVWAGGSSAGYTYTLSISKSTCTNDGLEPNNAAASPTVGKDDGSTINGVICVGDDDWFAVDVTQGQQIKVIQTRQAGSLLTTCIVDRDQVTNLACQWGWDTSLNATMLWNLTATGRYYVHIWAGGGSANYSYTLTIAKSICTNDASEPNESAQAPTVGKDDGSAISGVICVSDHDWYAVDVTQGQQIKVTVTRQAGSLLTTCIVDRDQITNLTCQWGWDASLTATLLWNLTATGRYYVHVWAGAGSASYTYSMTIAKSTCTNDANEPNDTYQTAKLAPDGTAINGTVCLNDDDWYYVDVTQSQSITVVGTRPVGSFTNLCIVDRDGSTNLTCKWYWEASGTINIKWSLTSTGRYFIHLWGGGPVNYQIMVTKGAACPADAQEPNEAPTQATSVTVSPTTYTASGCPGDEDWYSIAVANRQAIIVEVNYTRINGAMNFCIVDKDGVTMLSCDWQWGSSNRSILVWTLTTAATYYVRVWGAATPNSYTVKIAKSACGADGFEPNDGSTTAATMTPAGGPPPSATVTPNLCEGDFDWFKYNVGTAARIRVELNYTRANGPLGICIVDKDGVTDVVCQNPLDTTSNTVVLDWVGGGIVASATYYVRLWGWLQTTTNSYSLTVKLCSTTGGTCT